VESNEPTTPSRTAASGTFAPEAASTHEHKCSSRCAFVSLLRSPTTNAETIQEAPSSRYENYSMTPSNKGKSLDDVPANEIAFAKRNLPNFLENTILDGSKESQLLNQVTFQKTSVAAIMM